MNHVNNKFSNIDNRDISWGAPPAPLLPYTLRELWKEELLPGWVLTETGLSQESTIGDLDGRVWESMDTMSPRLKHYLTFIVRSRAQSIKCIKCLGRPWPLGLKATSIKWSVRTRNCLEQQGLLNDEKSLSGLKFGDLQNIESMGVNSFLDFAATVEGIMDRYDALTEKSESVQSDDRLAELRKSLVLVSEGEWPEQISSDDPRFSALLSVGSGSLSERIEYLLNEPDSFESVSNIPLMFEIVNSINNIRSELMESSLEEGLMSFLAAVSKQKGERLETLGARLGWQGNDPETLEESGQRLGVTRERMRQIQKIFTNRLPRHEICMPRLDQALDLLEKVAPATLPEASKMLREKSISKTHFSLESLLDAAELLNKETSLRICDTAAGEMLVNEHDALAVRRIPKLARKMAGQSGITNVLLVADALDEARHHIEVENLRRLLQQNPRFRFIDENWFWCTDIKPQRNRLLNISRKILSVVSPQSVHSIREGIRREFTRRIKSNERFATLYVPPESIIKQFFDQHPDYNVEQNLVNSNVFLDYQNELGETDQTIVEVMRTSPTSLMERSSLYRGCVEKGMNENTFTAYTTYSCVLDHIGTDIWKLRGVNVDPAAIKAIRIANKLRPKERRILEYGWNANGNLWMAARVPETGKNSLVIGCPSGMKKYLAGTTYVSISKDSGRECGQIVIKGDGTSYGYSKYISLYGIDQGDILLIEFDIASKKAFLSAIDDEYLEEII